MFSRRSVGGKNGSAVFPPPGPFAIVFTGEVLVGRRCLVSRLAESRGCIVDLHGSVPVQSLVGSPVVVVVEVARESREKCVPLGIAVQVDILVLDAAPKSFNEHVVQGASATVHTDAHVL